MSNSDWVSQIQMVSGSSAAIGSKNPSSNPAPVLSNVNGFLFGASRSFSQPRTRAWTGGRSGSMRVMVCSICSMKKPRAGMTGPAGGAMNRQIWT